MLTMGVLLSQLAFLLLAAKGTPPFLHREGYATVDAASVDQPSSPLLYSVALSGYRQDWRRAGTLVSFEGDGMMSEQESAEAQEKKGGKGKKIFFFAAIGAAVAALMWWKKRGKEEEGE
jgi:hypothetical protein